MPQYHLGRFFVPDDKDISDMLKSCGTPQDKMWDFAASFGILCSAADTRERMWEYLARLPLDRGKLLVLYDLNSSLDREEKYTRRAVEADISTEKITTVLTDVRDARLKDGGREKYQFEQISPTAVEVKVTYIEPDFSKTQSLQLREKEIKIVVEKNASSIAIRHHSNERAKDIVDDIEARIGAALGIAPQRRTLNFSGIRDAKLRTKFFAELIKSIPKTSLTDVPSLKVYRLDPKAEEAEDTDDGEAENLEGVAKRVFLSGANLMISEEYQQLEKRGFFIGSVNWIVELNEGGKLRYELAALFNDPENPTNLTYAASGKYEQADDGEYKSNRAKLSPLERDSLMKLLEDSANGIYEKILAEAEKGPGNGNTDQVADK